MRKLFLCLAIVAMAFGGTIVPELEAILAQAGHDEMVEVVVHTRLQADLGQLPPNTSYDGKISYLQFTAERAQQDLLNWLATTDSRNVRSFWLASRIALSATPDVIRALAEHPDVDYVIDDFTVTLDAVAAPTAKTDLLEWNITKVNAPACWADGYDGTGIVVGNLDTGVLVTHAALAGRWRSTDGWFDGVNGRADPYDDNNHGTHCMGSSVGGNGIGVAPGATFIAAKGFNSGGSGQTSWISACLDWFASTGRPDVLSNSWGGSRTETFWFTPYNNLRALGIVVVVSIGNSGPGSSTSNAPGNYPISIGVGATNSSDAIASFSSRGPAPNQTPWNNSSYWPRPDWNLINPGVSAPGVNIRSALRNGGYGTMDGTSMAGPHVAGAAAILLNKNPNLSHDEVFNLLADHSDRPSGGAPYPNNNYGWGRINCKASLDNVGSVTTPNLLLTRTRITDDPNGNGRLDPGETANLIAHIRNASTIGATNLRGTLRVSDPYVSIQDSTAVFGNLAGNDSTSNQGDPFVVSAAGNCPEGHIASMSLFLACDETTVTRTFNLTVGQPPTPGQLLMDHDTGYCRLTVSAQGSIGYDVAADAGSGFRYPKTAASALFYGSFAVGNAEGYVADRHFGRPASGPQNSDLRAVDSLRPVDPPLAGDQHYRGSYSDAGHSSPKGLLVRQNSYQVAESGYDDFVVITFDIANNGSSPVNGLHAGVFADFDIGADPTTNTVTSDESRRFTFMRQSSNANPTVGVKILAPASFANLAGVDHERYVYPDSAMSDGMKWRFLNGTIVQRNSNRAYDWSTLTSAGPFDLAVGQSYHFAVAFVGGTSENQARAHADSAQSWYDGNVGLAEGPARRDIPTALCEVLPNPFVGQTTVRLQLPQAGRVRVNVVDISGRTVATLADGELAAGRQELIWQPGSLAAGVYFVRVETPAGTTTRPVLLTR
ncbi:MAG TPA: T9SS type A sorting domain-containing protein [candidate division WOR-3 bacterium]|uniref:T9SS type A sorting domain-containing protein n=1 Tax=candidate division WOR-3 bacterium TaxID=2052148 RepID=A0A7V0T5F5_UNCW3|nr:T9SS type A sorting domain-containing protein [candidate division WOR-3 bacterium]